MYPGTYWDDMNRVLRTPKSAMTLLLLDQWTEVNYKLKPSSDVQTTDKTITFRSGPEDMDGAYGLFSRTKAKTSQDAIRISRSISVRRDGKNLPLSEAGLISVGEFIRIEIELQTESTLNYLTINQPLPAGFAWIAFGEAPTDLPIRAIRQNHDLTWWCRSLTPGKRKLVLHLQARNSGDFALPGLMIHTTDQLLAQQPGSRLTVRIHAHSSLTYAE